MASGPDLFVVCKNCGSEVSPYITECPYCGSRLRKRAPKLDKAGKVKEPRAARRQKTSLPRFKRGEIPGVRMSPLRPWATIALTLAAAVVTLGWNAGLWDVDQLVLLTPLDGEYWRLFTTTFVYDSTGYEIVALTGIFLFGWLLERRHGLWATVLVYAAGAAAGGGLVAALDEGDVAIGGNGPALALLTAWAARDVLGRRRGREDDSDLLGVAAFAAVLLLLPLAVEEAHALAGAGGVAAGVLLGLLLARLRER